MIPNKMSDQAVEAAVARILAINAERARRLAAGDKRVQYADHLLNVEHGDLRAALAIEFGRRHGWNRARSIFWNAGVLARRSTTASSIRTGESFGLEGDLFDHSYCYREASRPYRAAAIAAHLYNNSASKPGDLAEKANSLGLTLSWPDFPSWWLPGSTSLALYVPATSLLSRAA